MRESSATKSRETEGIEMAATKKGGTDQRRHTHSTLAGLEDAIAIVLDLLLSQGLNEYVRYSLNDLQEILSKIREGPNAYDIDRPAGERIIIRRRYIEGDQNG
jgi:hypothetical protein